MPQVAATPLTQTATEGGFEVPVPSSSDSTEEADTMQAIQKNSLFQKMKQQADAAAIEAEHAPKEV